jgi:molybdopterin-guanine dinucleotide biosynthesis protein MobB
MPPIVCIVGRDGSGKTRIIEGLVREMKARGHRVATLARSDDGPALDAVAPDAACYASAGSDAIVVASPDAVTCVRRVDEEASLDELIWSVGEEYDLLLVEGFPECGFPKIEVHRAAAGGGPVRRKSGLLALATDTPLDVDVPQFGLEDAAGLADLIEAKVLPTILAEDASVYVDGVHLPTALFVRKMVASTVIGMLCNLKGFGRPRSLRVDVRLRREADGGRKRG